MALSDVDFASMAVVRAPSITDMSTLGALSQPARKMTGNANRAIPLRTRMSHLLLINID